MPLEELNRFLDSIGTGSFAKSFSFGQLENISYIIGILIFLMIFLTLWTGYHKRKGTFTRPSVSLNLHREDIAHTINCELNDLYSKQSLVNSIVQKLGHSKPGKLAHGQLNTDSILILPSWKMGFVFVTKYALNSKEDVVNGKFGRIMLNKDFFASRTLHHHYCMMIAADLFFFQAYAIAGKDPKNKQSDEHFRKKAGETVLALAGKLQEYASLQEREVVSLTKNDFRIDDDISRVLEVGEDDAKKVAEEFNRYSRSIHDFARGKSHIVSTKEARILHLLKKEKQHLEMLVAKAVQKQSNVEQLMKQKGIAADEKHRLESFILYWEEEIARIRMICESLDKIIGNQARWEFRHSHFHHLQRVSKPETSDVSNKLHEESAREKIGINKVHAILTSFTEAKSNILKLMHSEEEAI